MAMFEEQTWDASNEVQQLEKSLFGEISSAKKEKGTKKKQKKKTKTENGISKMTKKEPAVTEATGNTTPRKRKRGIRGKKKSRKKSQSDAGPSEEGNKEPSEDTPRPRPSKKLKLKKKIKLGKVPPTPSPAPKTKKRNRYKHLALARQAQQSGQDSSTKEETSTPEKAKQVSSSGENETDGNDQSQKLGKKKQKKKKTKNKVSPSDRTHENEEMTKEQKGVDNSKQKASGKHVNGKEKEPTKSQLKKEKSKKLKRKDSTNDGYGTEQKLGTNGEPKSKRHKTDTDASHVEIVQNPSKSNQVRSPFNVTRLKNVLGGMKGLSDVSEEGQGDEKAKKKAQKRTAETSETVADKTQTEEEEGIPVKKVKKKSLRDRMQTQLTAARFRYINEQLYTRSGEEALELMRADPEAFKVYHEGFSAQVDKWPENPVDRVIQYVKNRPGAVVADFGCGDAKLAASVKNKVHSFDLVATNPQVTVCDMAHVPLENESVDVAVFCLALMGTNLVDFVVEASRVLKENGTLIVAEVVSRFEKVGSFVRKMAKLGFEITKKDDANKMFIWFEFTKTSDAPSPGKRPKLELMPCSYKKR